VLVDDADFPAVHRAAEALREDLAAVSGGTPDPASRAAIIAGTRGRSARVDRIVAAHGIDTTGVAGAWGAYLLQVVERPEPGVGVDSEGELRVAVERPVPGSDRAVVAVGADRRGTALGLYELSRRIGVSPRTWWAAVPPPRRQQLYVAPGRFTDAPKVRYRGI